MQTIARHYGLDWLRIGAFAGLILYHVGMVFVPWGWHVKAAVEPDWVVVPMLLLNPWRLALLFVVSGFAARALLARAGGAGRFLAARSLRLGLPLLFGTAVLVPPQAFVEWRESGEAAGSYLSFWLAYWLPYGAGGSRLEPSFNHLWFIAYLWVYCAGLGLLAALVPARGRRMAQAAFAGALGGWRILALPLAWLMLLRFVLLPGAAESHRLFTDAYGHLLFLPAFLFGVGLAGAPALWTAIRRWWPAAAMLAAIGYAAIIVVQWRFPGNMPATGGWAPVEVAARTLMIWGVILALLGLCDRRWNRDGPWRAVLAEAVFPFYLIHQTAIVLVAWWLKPLDPALGVFFALLVLATAIACWGFYLAARRIGWLRPLVGLARARRPAVA